MDPHTRTLSDLFYAPVRYQVPIFQRPYVWTRERQWQPLWDDVLDVLERHANAGDAAKTRRHFLGAIVLELKDKSPGSLDEWVVIDGQQRLTTLSLLLAAVTRVLADLGATTQAAQLEDLVWNPERRASGDARMKVWPTHEDRAAYRAAMTPDGPTAEHEASTKPTSLAYEFFREQVRAHLTDGEPDSAVRDERAKALRVALEELLVAVTIRLGG